jgi:Purple acid Phosphatase, N-terminal domain
MNKVLLTLAITVFSGSLLAQESPTTPKAARVRISQGPEIELAKGHLTIIRWTTNNPGGSPVHYGIVRYGTDPKDLSQTAKNPIRLNPDHSSTVFRVQLYNLKPRTTYYYTVDSMESNGKSDEVTSPVQSFTTL